MITPDLIDAYRRAEYRVSDGSFAFAMRVDEACDSLATCHAAFGVECSAFITAWNPRSTPAPREMNEAAMRRLEADLDARGYFVLQGQGADPSGAWAPEPSLLVLGLDEPGAVALARAYDQHAVVCAGPDAVPHLVFTAA
jgi:hypothetical protein